MEYTSEVIANSTNRFYISFNVEWNYEARARYHYIIKSNTDTLHGCFAVTREYDREGLLTYYNLNSLFSYESKNNIIISLKSIPFTMGNKTFPDCVIADSTNSRYDADSPYESHSRVETFVISKKYGLIYYKFEDGEEFFRKF